MRILNQKMRDRFPKYVYKSASFLIRGTALVGSFAVFSVSLANLVRIVRGQPGEKKPEAPATKKTAA